MQTFDDYSQTIQSLPLNNFARSCLALFLDEYYVKLETSGGETRLKTDYICAALGASKTKVLNTLHFLWKRGYFSCCYSVYGKAAENTEQYIFLLDSLKCGNGEDLPSYIDVELWDAWLEIRGKKANTKTALEMNLRKLAQWHKNGFDVNQILENSVTSGWQGIFAPNRKKESQNIKTGKGAIIV